MVSTRPPVFRKRFSTSMKYCLAWRPRSLFSTMASSLAISRLMKYSLAAKRPLFSPLIILSTVKSSPSLKPYLRILSLIQFANSCLDSRNFHRSRALTAVILSPFRVIPVVLMSSVVMFVPFMGLVSISISASREYARPAGVRIGESIYVRRTLCDVSAQEDS